MTMTRADSKRKRFPLIVGEQPLLLKKSLNVIFDFFVLCGSYAPFSIVGIQMLLAKRVKIHPDAHRRQNI